MLATYGQYLLGYKWGGTEWPVSVCACACGVCVSVSVSVVYLSIYLSPIEPMKMISETCC